jgi:transcription initiation factor TFIID subunit 9B
LPESFEVIRLPPAHQRLTEVNFDLVPDVELPYTDDEDDSESDIEAEEQDDARSGDERRKGDGEGELVGEDEADADGEDDDMEEVGVEPEQPVALREAMDEDYD